MMRPWLRTEEIRKAADAVIARSRRRALSTRPAPTRPKSLAAAAVEQCYATVCDGAGVQNITALCKHGRQWALVSVLIKDEEGVSDAWVGRGHSKRDLGRAMTVADIPLMQSIAVETVRAFEARP